MIKPAQPIEVLVEQIATHPSQMTGGLIHIESDDKQDKIQFYSVISVGSKVTSVKSGDTVMADWRDMTPTFNHEGKKIAAIPEVKIQAIVEQV